jgi:hypothetical protein
MFRYLALAVAVLWPGALETFPAQQIGASRTVLATVVDNRGRPIVDIEADDFVVRESGQPRDVLSIRVADYPIVLVLDNGRGAGRDLDAIRQAAVRFIGRIGHRPIAIAVADPPQLIATFDDERAVVMERLEKVKSSGSSEGLFQAVVSAARAIQETATPFAAIILVSASPVSSAPTEFLTPILDSGAAVHIVVNGNPPRDAGDPRARSGETLRQLADQTRGEFTVIFSAASYQVALDRLADRLAPELMIEYVVPVGSSSGNDVTLGVRIPGARVNARGLTR